MRKALTAPLVIILPAYNEEETIGSVISDWCACFDQIGVRFQIIALDDGSDDATFNLLASFETRRPKDLIVLRKNNTGHGRTCRLGYDLAACSNAEWVLQIDSDGQCDPKHFSAFWNRRAEFDCIFGIRKSRDDGGIRILTSAICRAAASLVCGTNLRDPNVPYRLIRREALARALRYIPADFNIQNVALTYVLRKLSRLRWAYVPIHFRVRHGGTNSTDVAKVTRWGSRMLVELIKIRREMAQHREK